MQLIPKDVFLSPGMSGSTGFCPTDLCKLSHVVNGLVSGEALHDGANLGLTVAELTYALGTHSIASPASPTKEIS